MQVLNSTKQTITQSKALHGELLDDFKNYPISRLNYKSKARKIINQELIYVARGYAELLAINPVTGEELTIRRVSHGFLNPSAVFIEPQPNGRQLAARYSAGSVAFGISNNTHSKMLTNSIAYAKAMHNSIQSQFIELENRCFDMAMLDVKGRVLNALKSLANCDTSLTHPKGYQISITRTELASHCGCSREMVGRVLGWLEVDGNVYEIPRTRKIVVTHKALEASK